MGEWEPKWTSTGWPSLTFGGSTAGAICRGDDPPARSRPPLPGDVSVAASYPVVDDHLT